MCGLGFFLESADTLWLQVLTLSYAAVFSNKAEFVAMIFHFLPRRPRSWSKRCKLLGSNSAVHSGLFSAAASISTVWTLCFFSALTC